ncbi:hypothetical protein [Nitrosomonas aestuarii]|uniref:hypothetical protein n=1 Tax=Nitrosomonas aestuarii TaxID=52441 RepID=UPI001481926D|nr:hypothetical protein [Nitrosomonas aestuarii]
MKWNEYVLYVFVYLPAFAGDSIAVDTELYIRRNPFRNAPIDLPEPIIFDLALSL